jgi:hypothetical protein
MFPVEAHLVLNSDERINPAAKLLLTVLDFAATGWTAYLGGTFAARRARRRSASFNGSA